MRKPGQEGASAPGPGDEAFPIPSQGGGVSSGGILFPEGAGRLLARGGFIFSSCSLQSLSCAVMSNRADLVSLRSSRWKVSFLRKGVRGPVAFPGFIPEKPEVKKTSCVGCVCVCVAKCVSNRWCLWQGKN